MSIILGINAFHGDSSACLVINGKLISAVEEERFRRIKHWAGFPSEAILYCLAQSNIALKDVDIIAVNSNPKANLQKKLGFSLNGLSGVKLVFDRLIASQKKKSIQDYLSELFSADQFSGEIKYIEHHHAHLSSAHCVGPFKKSITLSIDGLGDFVSTAWGVGNGQTIDIKGRIFFPHSLGIFYEAMTHYLGFKNYGDEYKVMGLAPLGKPKYLKEVGKIINLQNDGSFKLNLKYFSHQDGKVQHTWEGGVPKSGDCFGEGMIDLLGPARVENTPLSQRHMDIAHSVQKVYENAFFNLLNALYKRYKIDQLTLSGGCAMNSVANGKIYRQTPFKKVYIQSAAGDAGGAIGAAFVAANDLSEVKDRFYMDHAYWGPSFDNVYHEKLLLEKSSELSKSSCSIKWIKSEDLLYKNTAQAIANGLVIGWFQGRMEWGPRALGNRSILCDPRRKDMKDILNSKIKRRESFRPFAPSILREKVNDWFEEDDDVPFMMQVFQVKEERRTEIPAVTHVDGSGRLQTVSLSTNIRYHKLISAFNDLTGIPMVLNTSFNENEPVVCKPEEALNTFLRTKMDVLVLGNWFIRRNTK
ncbi:carbamoyltransferase [Candidatus Pseudothioglobus singularis]|nr:carbamoyltransferase [Candidatus Pseudothioglobus singularis]